MPDVTLRTDFFETASPYARFKLGHRIVSKIRSRFSSPRPGRAREISCSRFASKRREETFLAGRAVGKRKKWTRRALTGKSDAPPVKSRAFTGAIAPVTAFGRFRLDPSRLARVSQIFLSHVCLSTVFRKKKQSFALLRRKKVCRVAPFVAAASRRRRRVSLGRLFLFAKKKTHTNAHSHVRPKDATGTPPPRWSERAPRRPARARSARRVRTARTL